MLMTTCTPRRGGAFRDSAVIDGYLRHLQCDYDEGSSLAPDHCQHSGRCTVVASHRVIMYVITVRPGQTTYQPEARALRRRTDDSWERQPLAPAHARPTAHQYHICRKGVGSPTHHRGTPGARRRGREVVLRIREAAEEPGDRHAASDPPTDRVRTAGAGPVFGAGGRDPVSTARHCTSVDESRPGNGARTGPRGSPAAPRHRRCSDTSSRCRRSVVRGASGSCVSATARQR